MPETGPAGRESGGPTNPVSAYSQEHRLVAEAVSGAGVGASPPVYRPQSGGAASLGPS